MPKEKEKMFDLFYFVCTFVIKHQWLLPQMRENEMYLAFSRGMLIPSVYIRLNFVRV